MTPLSVSKGPLSVLMYTEFANSMWLVLGFSQVYVQVNAYLLKLYSQKETSEAGRCFCAFWSILCILCWAQNLTATTFTLHSFKKTCSFILYFLMNMLCLNSKKWLLFQVIYTVLRVNEPKVEKSHAYGTSDQCKPKKLASVWLCYTFTHFPISCS